MCRSWRTAWDRYCANYSAFLTILPINLATRCMCSSNAPAALDEMDTAAVGVGPTNVQSRLNHPINDATVPAFSGHTATGDGDMKRFDGKTVLVTGCTSGIGLATARLLAAGGARLVLTGRGEAHLEEARAALPQAEMFINDAAEPAAATALAREISARVGRIDGAFLNAGLGVFAPLDRIGAEDIDRHVAINLRAPLLQAQALDELVTDGGAFLLVSSATVGVTRADTLVYSATKAAVRQAARSLATQFAPRGIRVNVITPGLTNTNFHVSGGIGVEAQAAYKDKVCQIVPLGRLGEPDDVAKAACFLLSNDASYITGAELRVDGGLTMA